MARSRAWVSFALLAVAASVAAPVRADGPTGTPESSADSGAVVESRELFQRGTALAKGGRFSDALAAFERAAVLRPHAKTTYNIAYCERALGHATRAWRLFGRALDESEARGGELAPEFVDAARTYRDQLEAGLARVALTVVPAGARVTVDGRSLERLASAGPWPLVAASGRERGPGEPLPGATVELVVDPGMRIFALVDASGRSATVERRVEGSTSLVLDLERLAPKPALGAAAPGPSGDAERTVGLVLGGVGAAGVAAGAITAAVAAATWSDAKAACPTLTACPDDRGYELSGRARAEAHAATVVLASSAVALIGGAVLWLVAPSRPPPRSASPERRGQPRSVPLP